MAAGFWRFSLLVSFFICNAHCLTLQNDATMLPFFSDAPLPPLENTGCDPSAIPVMGNFDMKKFSGEWYELAKSASGYIDVNDGKWKIQTTNTSSMFIYTGRNNNGHCIRPIKGKIHASDQPPGTLTLHYKTYSNHVEETIRVLFTDYTSIAVIYKCVHHIHREMEVCHSAGLLGAIWTRQKHVVLSAYETGAQFLKMACVHKSVLILRNQVGPCEIDDVGFYIDEFPVPDFCYQPMDKGFCNGKFQRYYYDPKSRICESFTFHGCGGNRNNFMLLPECQESCMSISTKDLVCRSTAMCAMHCPPCCTEDRNGCVKCTCEDVIEDKYLNCKDSPASCLPQCMVEEFYLGCYVCSCNDVNEPVFYGEIEKPECIEEKEEGNCEDPVERYFYNARMERCESFIYSGCNGSKNNYGTFEECHETCIGPILKAEEFDENNSAVDIKGNVWVTLLILFMV